jgi:hypothetical protein
MENEKKEGESIFKKKVKKPVVRKISKSPKRESYTLLRDVKVGGILKKKGEKIKLTREGWKFFLSKKIV